MKMSAKNHRRAQSNAVPSFSNGPTSTTKALLIVVVAPRKFYTKPAEEDHDETVAETVTLDASSHLEQDDSSLKRQTESKETITNESNHSKSSHKSNEEAQDEAPTAEEAAAIVPTGANQEETEVNVEELLRISMQNLLEEWHLLNVPTYSEVMDKQSVVTKYSLHTLFSDHSLRVRNVTSFIRMDVMARPASLGVILERLERIGIGANVGTVSIYKCELCKTASPWAHIPEQEEALSFDENGDVIASDDEHNEDSNHAQAEEEKELQERAIQEARTEWKNAATRLRIEQVREQIVEQAAFSFDFIALLTVASILAAICLITDNTVVIVASMLVSPIMGPVLGLTFGSRIQDWPLVKISLLHEVYALLGCIVIGAFVGLASGFTPLATETWPTYEMQSRGEWTGVLISIAVAIPSGMGVCLSILGGNTSSLVGVAISASLLPPAVNSGVCLLYSILLVTNAVDSDSGLNAADFVQIGVVSFALTAINILCIWLSGIVMFEIKEVAPTKEKSAFWSTDIKEAREMNKREKPPPVNLTKLKQGIKAALGKTSGKPVKSVKICPPQREPSQRTSLDAAFAFQPTSHPVGGWSSQALSEEEKEEVVDDNVRYVGLEDMAKLLGFDQEDEEEDVKIDHAAVARGIGRGRYI